VKKETKRRYAQIYNRYALGNRTEQQVAEELGVSRRTVATALKWAVNTQFFIPNDDFIQILIDVVRQRKQELQADMGKAREQGNWNGLVGFHRELRAQDEFELKLRGLLKDKEEIRIKKEFVHTFVDKLTDIYNRCNELPTVEARRGCFVESLERLNWSDQEDKGLVQGAER